MLAESWKSQMLGLYYLATLPQRTQLKNTQQKERKVPVMALFYHRVANEHPNRWTISTSLFRSQIEWISERFDIVTLEDAQRRIGAEENHRPTISITFDDGYADNCDTAIPWLLEREIPFTYFVATDFVLSGKPFPHDLQHHQPLRPNTVEQIRQMAEQGVEIGAHSRSHADLGDIQDEATLYDEIVGSKRDLEKLIDKPVRYFAFPFGLPENMSRAAFRMAYTSGLWGVCSAYGDYNLPGDDGFHIKRIHGDPQWPRFRNWLTVDPRKLRRKKLFDPGDYRDRF